MLLLMKKWLWLILLIALLPCCRDRRKAAVLTDADAGTEDNLLEPRAEEPTITISEDRPLVEPPLREKPTQLFWAAAGCVEEPQAARQLLAKLATLDFLTPGYPALAQVPRSQEGCRFLVLAGKFARRPYAEKLGERLRELLKTPITLLQEPYSHDRFSPSAWLDQERPGAGRVWAGLPGEKIPLLAHPSAEAPALDQLTDGTWLSVLQAVETENGRWYRVKSGEREGYLAPGRLLCEHHVFPSPDGQRAVMSVEVGCAGDLCRSDWWLVDRSFTSRRLLAPAEEKFFHAFSPDGRRLAWAASARMMQLESFAEGRRLELGPGVSPSWTSDSARLYFRRPALAGQRDEILYADAPDWQVQVFYDLPGRPFYPRKLSAFPPAVDVFSADTRLYTMFLRLLEKDGGLTLVRWKAAFDSSGRLLAKKAEQLTE